MFFKVNSIPVVLKFEHAAELSDCLLKQRWPVHI